MRFLRFDLAAFGPFTERSLDFSGGPPGGLHLVHGRNAAGKSSALRAISDLLFGIPPKSGDDHVHPYQSLRLRAELESATGERVTLQRLKRNKDSLRDAHDAPLDDVVLKRLLGAVDRGMFEHVFGLDHERLRDAGQTLLKGGGDIGESLFDAGVGGLGVHAVLLRLREEAEQLFKPRGGKQEIAQLLDSYKAAKERVRPHSPELYLEQQRELERHRQDSESLARELIALRQERERHRLLKNALGSIAKRSRRLAELSELGELRELPADFSEQRERVQRRLSSHTENVARTDRDLERLDQRCRELKPPENLLEIGADAITDLREKIGSTKKALVDLPALEVKLADRRAEAQLAERRLGIDAARLTPDALRARRTEELKFRKLMSGRATLAERTRVARARLAEVELDHGTQTARLATLSMPSGIEALERAVLLARHLGDPEAALVALARERGEIAVLSSAELGMLAPFDGTLAELCALRVPASETILRFEQGFAELAEQENRLRERRDTNRQRVLELTRERAAEDLAGALPSEDELERTRKTRDDRFEELWGEEPEGKKKKPAAMPLFEAARLRDYRTLVGLADTLADRLRREASRVAENARRAAELAQLDDERARFELEEAALARQRKELEQDWASSWAEAGFEPVRPAEMRGWLARRDRAVALVVKETAVSTRAGELEQQREDLTAALSHALGKLPENTPLRVSVARAEERLGHERAVATERKSLEANVAELEVRRSAAERELDASARESAELDAELVRVMTGLGFDPALGPDEVEARLEELGDLIRARDTVVDLERRVAGIRRDNDAFERNLKQLVEGHAPDLAGLPPARAATELVERFTRAESDAKQLTQWKAELSKLRAERDEQVALRDAAERDAALLLGIAGATELRELPGIEARAGRARELRAEIDGLEATLGETAGGRGLDALLEEAAATDLARVSGDIDDLEGRITELEDRRADAIRSHQSVQAGLALYSDTSTVEAAQEERVLGSMLITRSERWAKLKLAEVLLEREIERYREQNQGPVLRRTSELFTKLTDGAFRTLRVGREERALVAVRSNDHEVTVDGLNEAARYHLYLALRLASLERYLEHAEPLPLVLDDVLIHFDEDGARAALSVLGELAGRLQILLFSHHRHNLELAEKSVPKERLFVHEL